MGWSRTVPLALDEMQDSTRNVISMEMWRHMGERMGRVEAMGGPATGILARSPAAKAGPPATRGMDHPVPQSHRHGVDPHPTVADSAPPPPKKGEHDHPPP